MKLTLPWRRLELKLIRTQKRKHFLHDIIILSILVLLLFSGPCLKENSKKLTLMFLIKLNYLNNTVSIFNIIIILFFIIIARHLKKIIYYNFD